MWRSYQLCGFHFLGLRIFTNARKRLLIAYCDTLRFFANCCWYWLGLWSSNDCNSSSLHCSGLPECVLSLIIILPPLHWRKEASHILTDGAYLPYASTNDFPRPFRFEEAGKVMRAANIITDAFKDIITGRKKQTISLAGFYFCTLGV